MSTIPTINEHDIRTFVGEQNFLKGQQYNRAGSIINPVQQGVALKAYCYGSLPEPYRVQVTCNDTDITAALCSCSGNITVYRFDVEKGGFDLTKDIPPQFLQDTTPEEKHLVAQWVRTALAELQENKQESDWRRKRYGSLLLALEVDILSDEEFLRIGRETKSIQEVVIRLLELGRVDEAVQDASHERQSSFHAGQVDDSGRAAHDRNVGTGSV